MPPKMGRTIQARQHKQAKKIKREESTKPTRCYLLKLPAEIRNYIIEIVLTSQYPGILVDVNEGIDEPGIARTCRQLRTETLSIFYSQNALHLSDLDMGGRWNGAKSWLKVVAKHIPFVQELRFMFCDYHRTWLTVKVKPEGEGCRTTIKIGMDEPGDDGERCKAVLKWSEVEHALRGIFKPDQHRSTAKNYILVGDIMVHTDGRYCCQEEDFDED